MSKERQTKGQAAGPEYRADEVDAIDRTASLSPSERASRETTPGRERSSAVASGSGGAALSEMDEQGLLLGNPDRYEYKGEHARGGLGRVVRAEDRSLLRTVAIKELLHESPTAAARFMREALVTARLEHPGIVPIYEAGQWPTGEPYYTMKLVSGRTLKELGRSCESLRERLALLANAIAVAETIAYAHSEGVIHRDLKPSNVVIGDFGETVVIDWGLAKDLRKPFEEELAPAMSGVSGEHTVAGDVLGTPAYMPPEQARGEEVDERADVYSLGALLYEILGCKPPYSGVESDEIIAHVLDGPPASLDRLQPDLPPDLLAIVSKAMSRDPDGRYATAKQLAEDLKRYQTGQLVSAHSYSTGTLIKRWLWRHRGAVGVAIVFLAALVVGGVVAFNRVVEERNLAETQRVQAERRGNDLVFLQARTNLDRDPTATIAWLKSYPLEGRAAHRAHAMMDEARARGVARHVFRTGDAVRGLAFSPDGEWVAPASKDGVARIWSLASGEERVLGQQDGGVSSVAFSADGRLLATGGRFGAVVVWDLESGTSRELGTHGTTVARLVFARNGTRLLSSDELGGGRAWNVTSGEQIAKSGTEPGTGDVAENGSVVALAEALGKLWVYDVDSSKRRELATLPSRAGKLRFSPDGTRIVIHTKDGKLKVADVAAGAVRELGERQGFVYGIEFSADGKRVATAGVDGVAHVWDLDSGESTTLRGHEDAIYMAVFSPDGNMLVTAGDDATARVWHLTTGAVHVLRGHDDDVLTVVFSPDATSVATGSMDGSVRVWPLDFDDSRALVAHDEGSSRIRAPHVGWSLSTGIGHLSLAADDRTVITHSGGGQIRRWDIDSGESRLVGQAAMPEAGLAPERPPVSKDGKLIATRGENFTIDLWETATGKRRSLSGHEADIGPGTFTPDSRYLISGGADGKVIIWDTAGEGSRTLDVDEPVTAGAIAEDGQSFVVMGDSQVRVFDFETFRELKALKLAGERRLAMSVSRVVLAPDSAWLLIQTLGVGSTLWHLASGEREEVDLSEIDSGGVALSPDGRLLAGGTGARQIVLWDVQSRQRRILRGHTDLIFQLAFSPDGERLASVSYDRTVRLWDTQTGEARVLRGHAGGVATLDFSRDGSLLVTGGDDNTLRVWRLDLAPARTVEGVRARLDRLSTAVIGDDDRPISRVR